MSGLTPQEMAEACARAMLQEDVSTRHLGINLDCVAPGAATLSMTVAACMTNGHGICHGGFIFSLADSAFAFACNSYNQRAVTQHCAITFIASAFSGDRLTATAREVSRRGRSGIYDITVTNQSGDKIAEFRGHSSTIKGTHLPERS
jgi:acyl-CoA thioesterase